MTAYINPILHNMLTMQHAKITPTKFALTALQNGMPRMYAPIAPLHAPVPGRGTATKSIKPSHLNSLMGPLFLWVFSNSQSSAPFKIWLLVATKAEMWPRERRRRGTGSILLWRRKTNVGSRWRYWSAIWKLAQKKSEKVHTWGTYIGRDITNVSVFVTYKIRWCQCHFPTTV